MAERTIPAGIGSSVGVGCGVSAGCGVLTVLIRYFGSYAEGATYAILIMNTCTWFIDKLTQPRQFGMTGEDVKAKKAAAKAAKKQAKEAAV